MGDQVKEMFSFINLKKKKVFEIISRLSNIEYIKGAYLWLLRNVYGCVEDTRIQGRIKRESKKNLFLDHILKMGGEGFNVLKMLLSHQTQNLIILYNYVTLFFYNFSLILFVLLRLIYKYFLCFISIFTH